MRFAPPHTSDWLSQTNPLKVTTRFLTSVSTRFSPTSAFLEEGPGRQFFISRSATRFSQRSTSGLRSANAFTPKLLCTCLTPEVSCAIAPAMAFTSSEVTWPCKVTSPWLVSTLISNGETRFERSGPSAPWMLRSHLALIPLRSGVRSEEANFA